MKVGVDMNYDLVGFGKKLLHIRENLKLSQKDVKNIIGINEDTLRKVENGYVLPKIDTLDKLSMVYKCDIYLIFSKYRLTVDNYIAKRIKEHAKDFKNYDYKKLKSEADHIKKTFKDNKYFNDAIISKKKNQYYEYLMSLHNLNHSFSDPSRKDLSQLFGVLDYTINDFYSSPEDIYFDKLEMLILLLIAIIYRYINEFDNSKVIMDRIEHVLHESHKHDPDFMYYYILLTYNKMTLYNRNRQYEEITLLFDGWMKTNDMYFNNQNVLTLLMRAGLSACELHKPASKELVITAITLLDEHVNHDLASKYKALISKNYSHLNIF